MKQKEVTKEQYKQIADQIIGVWDYGESVADRYTVAYDETEQTIGGKRLVLALAMGKTPFHPQGFCQHCTAQIGDHLGESMDFFDLPIDCQIAVYQDCIGDV